ncbi:hypothetical protein NDN13_01615 [Acinetobacter sp. C32I]|uniref:hypothetical protein n=1 Tax=Acinetobacter sp. C32I TaxID=2950074 RepID=UPI0020372919|nr:hypothetical protein [Acinetobacter sp. C32I]USA53917.1 hypothetical protein NDN13_01615 [Acinetobacter sp. C32I]
MNTSSKDFELIKIILEDATGYFENRSCNDFYLSGDDTPERLNVFRDVIETQADEDEKEELLGNLNCWTFDFWVARYITELSPQIKLNQTQLEICLLLLEEVQQVPFLLQGEFRFEKSELYFLEDNPLLNNPNINEDVYYIDSLKITEYLIEKTKKSLLLLL